MQNICKKPVFVIFIHFNSLIRQFDWIHCSIWQCWPWMNLHKFLRILNSNDPNGETFRYNRNSTQNEMIPLTMVATMYRCIHIKFNFTARRCEYPHRRKGALIKSAENPVEKMMKGQTFLVIFESPTLWRRFFGYRSKSNNFL